MIKKVFGILTPSFLGKMKEAFYSYLEDPQYSPFHKLVVSVTLSLLGSAIVVTAANMGVTLL